MEHMTDQPHPDADPLHLSEEIRALVRNLSARLRIESAQVTDLPVPQQSVLMRLAIEPGQTGAELARAEFVRPQSMNATVSALRQQGLVETAASAEDARRKVLNLTDAGRDELRRIRSSRSDWLSEQLTTSLSDADRELLARALDLLREIARAPVETLRTPASDRDASPGRGAASGRDVAGKPLAQKFDQSN